MFTKKRAQWLEKLRTKEVLNTELHNAITYQRPDAVEGALRKGADPNSRHGTTKEPAIFPVCAKGNIEITKILLQRGADPNIIFGSTPRIVPLVIAVIYNRTAICKILLAFGANPNGPPGVQGTEKLIQQEEKPVYHAAMGWRISISQVLLNGDWRKVYANNCKKTLEKVLATIATGQKVEDLITEILDFLRLGDVEVDIGVITDEDTWSHMEDERNPTLKLYKPYNTKRNLLDIGELLEDDSKEQLIRANNNTGIEDRGTELYGDVLKFLDESE